MGRRRRLIREWKKLQNCSKASRNIMNTDADSFSYEKFMDIIKGKSKIFSFECPICGQKFSREEYLNQNFCDKGHFLPRPKSV